MVPLISRHHGHSQHRCYPQAQVISRFPNDFVQSLYANRMGASRINSDTLIPKEIVVIFVIFVIILEIHYSS